MILALGVLATAAAGGTLATYLCDDDAPLYWRVSAGTVVGLAALGIAGLVFAAIAGLGGLALVLSTFTVLSPALLLLRRSNRQSIREDLQRAATRARALLEPSLANLARMLCLFMLALAVWTVNDRVIFERVDGLYTGVANNIGDLPFHLAIITRFFAGGTLPPENPIYAGTSLTYPFLADFVTGMFAAAGASLRASMLLVNVPLMLALVALIYRWALVLAADRAAAWLTPALLLLNGGFGWWQLVIESEGTQRGIAGALMHLPHDYTIMSDGGWRWGNVITSMLLPQRSFQLGLPLAILTFTLWKRAFDRATAEATVFARSAADRMLAAGVCAGMLPLAHLHSYAIVIAVAGCLAVAGRVRTWTPFFGVALAMGAIQILWLASGTSIEPTRYIGWQFGWDHGNENIFWFWLKNTGVMIPLVTLAILWRGRSAPVAAQQVRWYLPFIACLLVPNVLRLSPWIWDNNKFLIYWHVASAPLVAILLVRVWRMGRLYRWASVALVLLLTTAGALDVWRVASRASENRVFTRDGINFADLVRHTVPAGALILHAPTYNQPVFLSGRRSLIGYPGHLWSHGIAYEAREADVKRIYSGDADAEALLARYAVSYIVVSPLERELLTVNDDFFKRFHRVGLVDDYALFRVARSQ